MIVSGSQLHAARALAGLSRQELADKSHVACETIGVWERSSDAAIAAKPALINRTVAALAAAGVVITDDGVRRMQTPIITAPSERPAAS